MYANSETEGGDGTAGEVQRSEKEIQKAERAKRIAASLNAHKSRGEARRDKRRGRVQAALNAFQAAAAIAAQALAAKGR